MLLCSLFSVCLSLQIIQIFSFNSNCLTLQHINSHNHQKDLNLQIIEKNKKKEVLTSFFINLKTKKEEKICFKRIKNQQKIIELQTKNSNENFQVNKNFLFIVFSSLSFFSLFSLLTSFKLSIFFLIFIDLECLS